MLEANPNLGWRDVKEILSLTARHVGSPIDAGPQRSEFHDWFFNGATDWNGGGRHFSEDYGYGLVDAHAAVRLAETWTRQSTSANEMHSQPNAVAVSFGPLNGGSTNGCTFLETDQMTVETVTVNLSLTHTRAADLRIWMVSPSGTVVELLRPGTADAVQDGLGAADFNGGWQFSTTAFMGESAAGAWNVFVQDVQNNSDTGMLTNAVIDIFGAHATADDVYVYTDEFGTIANDGGHRFVAINSNGGTDTINAAAVTTDTTIDFANGHYIIAGREGFFGGGFGNGDPNAFMIENIVTGDGDDTVNGNIADNWIRGMRGSDTLAGGDGNDWLDGGAGVDNVYGGHGDDTLVGTYERNFAFEIMDGGEDNDTANFASFGKAIWVDLEWAYPEVQTRDGTDLTTGTWRLLADLNSVENLVGGAADDEMWGDGGINRIEGGGGSDTLHGRGGNDILIGGLSADNVYGEGGDDTLVGTYERNFGFDFFDGGEDTDTADFASFDKAIWVDLEWAYPEVQTRDRADLEFRPLATAGRPQFNREREERGRRGRDLGQRNGQSYRGRSRSDIIHGRGGNDILIGGFRSRADVTNFDGADVIYGDGGDDVIAVLWGDDEVHGGDNVDTLSFAEVEADSCTRPRHGSYHLRRWRHGLRRFWSIRRRIWRHLHRDLGRHREPGRRLWR